MHVLEVCMKWQPHQGNALSQSLNYDSEFLGDVCDAIPLNEQIKYVSKASSSNENDECNSYASVQSKLHLMELFRKITK